MAIIPQKIIGWVMYLVEPRGNDGKKPQRVTFSEAILNPNASLGGIYAPEKLPLFDTSL